MTMTMIAMTITVFKVLMVMRLMKKHAFTKSCHVLNNGVTSEVIPYIYINEKHEIAEKFFLSSIRESDIIFYSSGNNQYVKYMFQFKILYS